MTRLFIEDTEVELDDAVQFAITKQFEDMQNPTSIINDWSKSVEIPSTKSNDELFGHIYNPDKVIVSGGSTIKGIYFDPTKKLNFRLEWDEDVLMSGYAKMVDIKRTNGKLTYNITLNGELGKVFQELKKLTFDATEYDSGTTEYTKYYIDGSEYVSETINKTLVASSWTSHGQESSTLQKKTESGYEVTDIIGFAPNNSYCEDFDYKTFQNNSGQSMLFSDVLEDGSFKSYTNIDADTAIGEGLLPRDIGEYRSYQQLPFIYFNKLFQLFQAKGEALTGYDFELDSTWFNTNNPLWYKLVYMLERLQDEKNLSYNNNYENNPTGDAYNYTYAPESASSLAQRYHYNFSENKQMLFPTVSESSMAIYNSTTGVFGPYTEYGLFDNSTLYVNYNINSALNRTLSSNTEVRLSTAVGMVVRFYAKKTDNTTVDIGTVLIKDAESTLSTTGYNYVYDLPHATIINTGDTIGIDLPQLSFTLPHDLIDEGFTIWSEMHCVDNSSASYVSVFQYKTSSSWGAVTVGDIHYNIEDISVSMNLMPLIYRSGGKFTLNNLWNNEYNLFSEIIKYCKMFRIGIFCDTINKKLTFKPYHKYFQSYTIQDWTDKLDTSKELIIKPVTLESKYILFNYDDSDTKIGQKYVEQYGLKCGEYKITTDYNFNTDTDELFDGMKQTIVFTDNVLSWTNLYERHIIEYSVPAEYYVHCYDDDKKNKSVFGSYYLHRGRRAFDTTERLHLRSVKLSDDTNLQQNTNTYFYTQSSDDTISMTYYPYLSEFAATDTTLVPTPYVTCTFGVPKASFSSEILPDTLKSVYYKYWKKYIEERYNIQNKQVTCYLRLKPYDYINFDYNHFITIENQLYMVNKIYDYDMTSNESTKVDLLTIQDINNYTTIN